MTGVVLDHVSGLLQYYLGKTRDKSIFFSEKRPIDAWGGSVLSCDVSLTPEKYRFFQLIICCWFELGMSSLNAIEL